MTGKLTRLSPPIRVFRPAEHYKTVTSCLPSHISKFAGGGEWYRFCNTLLTVQGLAATKRVVVFLNLHEYMSHYINKFAMLSVDFWVLRNNLYLFLTFTEVVCDIATLMLVPIWPLLFEQSQWATICPR